MQAFESEEKKYIPKQAQLSVTQPSLLMTSRPGTVSYFSKPSTYSINKKQFYRNFFIRLLTHCNQWCSKTSRKDILKMRSIMYFMFKKFWQFLLILCFMIYKFQIFFTVYLKYVSVWWNFVEPVSVRSSVGRPRKSRSFPAVTLWVYGDKQDDIQDTFREISKIIQSKAPKQDFNDPQIPNLTLNEARKYQRLTLIYLWYIS